MTISAHARRSLGTRFIIAGASTALLSTLLGVLTTLASANLFLSYAPTLAALNNFGYAAAMCFGMPFASGFLCTGIALRSVYRPGAHTAKLQVREANCGYQT